MCLITGNCGIRLWMNCAMLINFVKCRWRVQARLNIFTKHHETCSAFLGPSTPNYKCIRRHCESFHHRRSTCWRVCRGSSNTTFGARRTGPATRFWSHLLPISCQWVMNSHRRDDWRDWAKTKSLKPSSRKMNLTLIYLIVQNVNMITVCSMVFILFYI